jgi:hypothetical protein
MFESIMVSTYGYYKSLFFLKRILSVYHDFWKVLITQYKQVNKQKMITITITEYML